MVKRVPTLKGDTSQREEETQLILPEGQCWLGLMPRGPWEESGGLLGGIPPTGALEGVCKIKGGLSPHGARKHMPGICQPFQEKGGSVPQGWGCSSTLKTDAREACAVRTVDRVWTCRKTCRGS